ncbi:MAG: PEP-CTERM sorting domain-containing protein [Alphaproteobacteria bacterium]|nr:PEP-CTERM sorting domain-containing protein [Alphaproteobacteria bacterium]
MDADTQNRANDNPAIYIARENAGATNVYETAPLARTIRTWAATLALCAPLMLAAQQAQSTPIVPFPDTGDLFVTTQNGIVRVDETTGALSFFVTDSQIQTATAADPGASGGGSYGQTNLAFDSAGNLYFTDDGADSVLRRTAGGALSVLASQTALEAAVGGGGNVDTAGVAFGNDGFLYVLNDEASTGRSIVRVDPDSGAASLFVSEATLNAAANAAAVSGSGSFNFDGGVVGSLDGKIYVTNEGGNPRGVFEVDLGTGVVTELASGDADLLTNQPAYITRGPNGDLFVGHNGGGNILRITPGGDVSEFLSEAQLIVANGGVVTSEDGGIAFDDAGNFYLLDDSSDNILKFVVDDALTDPEVTLPGSIFVAAADFQAFDDNFNGLVVGIAFAPVAQSTAVPEPANLALFGIGLLGLGWVRQRKRKTA